MKKWHLSRQIFHLNINLSCPNPSEDWHSLFPGPLDFEQPNTFLDEVAGVMCKNLVGVYDSRSHPVCISADGMGGEGIP